MNNLSINLSSEEGKSPASMPCTEDTSAAEKVTCLFNMAGIPMVILLGIIGSSLSLCVFIFSHMRAHSSTVYLGYLNVVDIGFLCSLIPAWLGWVNIDLFFRNGWCQMTVFSNYLFSFLSVWTVVAFTVERFIVVYYPFKKPIMCTRRRAFTVVGSLTLGGLCFYSYALITTGIKSDPETGFVMCSPLPKYEKLQRILTTVDSAVTMIIPFLSISVLNGAIIFKIYGFSQRKRKRSLLQGNLSNDPASIRSFSESEHTTLPKTVVTHQLNNNESSSLRVQESHLKKRNRSQLKMTRSLVLISSTFIILNSPSHGFRLYFILSSLFRIEPKASPQLHIIQELAQFIYYINFATNMLQYIAFSPSFREGIVSMVAKCFRKQNVRKDTHSRI